jgi:putative Mn2+ efflux pump MntP
MFDRSNLIRGILFIGLGIIILIPTIWVEPLITDIADYQWMILVLRLAGIISIVVGIIFIIASLIPKKEDTKIEQKQKQYEK